MVIIGIIDTARWLKGKKKKRKKNFDSQLASSKKDARKTNLK